MNTYCGNNRLEPSVLNGTRRIGTRYECLKKGFGIGKTLPRMDGLYEAIDERTYYCGNANRLPNGYDLMGSPSICLRKGIGNGRTKSAVTKNRLYWKRGLYAFILICMTIAIHLVFDDQLYTIIFALGMTFSLYVAYLNQL